MGKRVGMFLILLCLVFIGPVRAGWISHDIDLQGRVGEIYAVDMDSDGDLDVVLGDISSQKIVWYENKENSEFFRHLISDSVGGVYSIYVTDLDSDGDLDVVSGSATRKKVAWHENNGNINFTTHIIDDSADEVYSVSAADMDSDGDIDIISANEGDFAIVLYENKGHEKFVGRNVDWGGWGFEMIRVADVDSDGDTDIVSTTKISDKIDWHENNGSAYFTKHFINNTTKGISSIRLIDLDSDGDLDIISTGRYGDLLWHENDGNENFTTYNINKLTKGGYYSVDSADIDSDGDLDVVSSGFGSDEKVAWHENNGNMSFTSHVIANDEPLVEDVLTADINSDGKMDVVSGTGNGILRWHEFNFYDDCSGKINIFTKDSRGNALSGAYIYLNNKTAKTTNADGFTEYEISDSTCQAPQRIQARCSDNITLCGTKTTTISSQKETDTITFICDICQSGNDIFINKNELTFSDLEGSIQVNVLVHSIGIDSKVNVSLVKSCSGVKSIVATKNIFISKGGAINVSFVDDLAGCEKIDVSVEPPSEEDSISNNFAKDILIVRPAKIYLEVNTGHPSVDDAIRDFVTGRSHVVSKDDSDIQLYIGRRLAPTYDGVWGISDNIVKYKNKKENMPYAGIVAKEKNRVYIFGSELDGTIAATRRLIEKKEDFLNKRELETDALEYLGRDDVDAISVFDYLHMEENQPFYKKEGTAFEKIVANILKRQTFNLDIKRVLTSNDNTSLRMKNINHELSPAFKEFANPKPVVLARGLWSNIFSWQGLAEELAVEENRDAWLIEITGGPNTECETCPNYDFDDLTNHYWPALIGGVMAYSGQDEIDYVGFSNGCRTALGGLEKWQDSGKADVGFYYDGTDWVPMGLETDFVDTFVGVGCPGAFEGSSLFRECLFEYGEDIRDYFIKNNIYHISSNQLGEQLSKEAGWLSPLCYLLGKNLEGDGKISIGLSSDYSQWIRSNSDSQPGSFDVNEFFLIYGIEGFGTKNDNDYIVTKDDSMAILNNIQSIKKSGLGLKLRHNEMPDNLDVIIKIKEALK